MGQFFSGLTEQIRGTGLADPEIADAKTVLAALAHAARPISSETLSIALNWRAARLNDAIEALLHHPSLTDPFLLTIVDNVCTLQIRTDRLSPAQRGSLRPWASDRWNGSE